MKVVEELKVQLSKSSRNQPVESSANSHSDAMNKVKELTKSVDDLSQQLSFKEVVVQTLEMKLEHLSQANTELNCKNIALEESVSRQHGTAPAADAIAGTDRNGGASPAAEGPDLPAVLDGLRSKLAVAQSEKEAAFEDNARLVAMLDALKLKVTGNEGDAVQYEDLFFGFADRLDEKVLPL